MRLSAKPCLLGLCCLVVASFSIHKTAAQQPLKQINSAELITEGVKLHDKGEYKKAMALYRQVPEGDTNYIMAVNELLVSALADSSFEEARTLALKTLATPNIVYRREFMLYLGHAYDYLGQKDEALHCYDSLIRMNPYDHQPLYEKGVVFLHQQKYEEAATYFQRALMVNPYHFRSHYMLGNTLAMRGRFTEAYLALCSALFTTNDANAAQGVIYSLSSIARQTDEMAQAFRSRKQADISPAYEEIDAIINSKLALNTAYKFKSELSGDKVINTLHAILEKLAYEAGDDNFVMQYYVPLYTKVYKNEAFDPLVIMMFSGYNIESVDKLAKKNATEVKEMQQYIFTYLDKIASTQILNHTARKKTPDAYAFIPAEKIFIIGAIKSKKPLAFNAGPVTMYKNGLLSATGSYDAAGEKDGEWKYYHTNGQLSSVHHYKGGKNTGSVTEYYPNGNLKEEYVFDEEGKQIKDKEYAYSGALVSVTIAEGGKKKITLYHPNGQKEFEGMAAGKKVEDGPYKYYNRDGSVKKTVSVVSGKWDGNYKEYFRNGKLSEESNYKAGNRHGSYTSYYNNGQLYFKGGYEKDLLEGPWEEYSKQGVLTGKGNYHLGKKQGVDSSFAADGRFYGLVKYKADMPVAVYFVDRQGKVIADDKDEQGLKVRRFFYPDGNLLSEVSFKNGTEYGPAKYYYRSGSLWKVINYKDGLQDGLSTEYYKNGVIKVEAGYKKGVQEGYYKHNYESGILNTEGWWSGSKKQGIWRSYNPAGKLGSQRHYVNDELNGPVYTYLPNGKLNYIDIFDRNLRTGLIQYDTTGREFSRLYFPGGNGMYTLKYPNGKTDIVCSVKYGEFDGAFRQYLPNGTLLQKGRFDLGKQDSTYESYSQSGVLKIKGNYRDDKQEGVFQYYDEEGALWREIHFVDGNRDGIEKVWEKGVLRYEYNMADDQRDGLQKVYGENNKTACVLQYEEGNLTGYTYEGKDGKLMPVIPVKNGTCKIAAYYPNDKKSADFEFKESIYNGPQFIYYSNGQKAEERTFDKGDQNGVLRKWTTAGKIAYESVYKNSQNEGKELEYDSKGGLLTDVYYLEGGSPHGTATYIHPKTRKKVIVYYYYGQIVDAR